MQSWIDKARDEVKPMIIKSLVESGAIRPNDTIENIWEYVTNPKGTLIIIRHYDSAEAESLGLFVPMFGSAKEEVSVENPFPPEWWMQWETEAASILAINQTARIEAEKSKRF